MLAPNFVEAEIKSWIEESRPNLVNLNDLLPRLAFKIIQAYEQYKHSMSTHSDRPCYQDVQYGYKDDH